jgi:hypothetical protein
MKLSIRIPPLEPLLRRSLDRFRRRRADLARLRRDAVHRLTRGDR